MQTIPSTLLNTGKKEVLKMVKKGLTLSVVNAKTKKELFIISPPRVIGVRPKILTDLTDIYNQELIDLTEYELTHPYETPDQNPTRYHQKPVARYRN